MYYTGFADEASSDFRKQIQATLALGWDAIESRGIGNGNLASISDEEFEEVSMLLEENKVRINCFGSTIANWHKDPRKEEDFLASRKELTDALPRMKKLGIGMLRGMSFAIVRDEDPDSAEIRAKVFPQIRELVKICEDAGVLYLHENCMNYGGMSYEHTLRLLEEIDSPNFKLVFDTGNTVMTWDRRGKKPYKKQSSWEFYSNVREYIHYVHIKDGRFIRELEGKIFPEGDWTFPGEGDGDVVRIVRDLLERGYDGGFSMEPHMSVVFHENGRGTEEDLQMENYIEYGRRFMKIVDEIRES